MSVCYLQVEYDLEKSTKDDLQISSTDRIEQSAVPQSITWYPPITKEHFILTANDQVSAQLSPLGDSSKKPTPEYQ